MDNLKRVIFELEKIAPLLDSLLTWVRISLRVKNYHVRFTALQINEPETYSEAEWENVLHGTT